MNSKRKADLQRRLSMASMPKPPAGLAARIKNDIPDLLATARERERLSRSMLFNMRVAASIILLVSSAYLCLHLLSRSVDERTPMAGAAPQMKRVRVADGEVRVPQPQRALDTPAAAPQQMAIQHLDESTSTNEPAISTAAPERPAQVAEVRPSAPESIERRRAARESDAMTITASAPAVVSPKAVPPPPAPAPAPAPSAAAEKITVTQNAPVVGGVVGGITDFISPPASAADLNLAPRNEVFGISTDPNAFARVKGAIEHGERPRNVNVEALINYFAGAPRRAPREVSLDVEASPAPLNAGPRGFIIRTTVDTARVDLAAGASVPPIATDAHLDVELDPDAVVSHYRIGYDASLSLSQPTLLKNVSATTLLEVELRPNLPWRQRVATVRLHYRSIASGHERTVTRVIRASDFAHGWPESSTRHRLASLGAVWGETLKNAPGANDVARQAEELANQAPKESRARELATLASASSRLQSSAPTGSGR
jgi:hypothetical protein